MSAPAAAAAAATDHGMCIEDELAELSAPAAAILGHVRDRDGKDDQTAPSKKARGSHGAVAAAPSSSSSAAATALASAASVESDKGGEDDEVAIEDIIHQSEVTPKQIRECTDRYAAAKKPKVICVFTEKGGVGKTTAVFNMVTSSLAQSLGKILVIDADPQSNTSHCFMSPSIMRKMEARFPNVESFSDNKADFSESILFTPLLPGFKGKVHVVLGKQLNSKLESRLTTELEERSYAANLDAFTTKMRGLMANYAVTIIDMNPSFSALNKILLEQASDVLELVTGDVFAQASMQKLVEYRAQNKLNFDIGVVPSMIRRSRGVLKPSHRLNVQKIFTWVKEKRVHDKTVRYLGFIGFADSIYGTKPLEFMRKPSARQQDLVKLREDTDRVFMHLLNGDQEQMIQLDEQFLWEKSSTLEMWKPADKGLIHFYVFREKSVTSALLAYKIGISKEVETRSKQIRGDYKTNFDFIVSFKCPVDVGVDVERKLKCYYLTSKDVGEKITENAKEFAEVIPLLDDRKFIEDFLLEA